MPFVGVIAEYKDYETIKNMLAKKNLGIELMQIKEKNIQNIKNIKFDTILINKEIESNREYLKRILENAKYLIINSDIELKQDIYQDIKLQIITYGFNNKATITASSVTENSIIICAQRNIKGINQNQIEQQEYNIKTQQNKFKNSYNAMAYFAISSIYNIKDI